MITADDLINDIKAYKKLYFLPHEIVFNWNLSVAISAKNPSLRMVAYLLDQLLHSILNTYV